MGAFIFIMTLVHPACCQNPLFVYKPMPVITNAWFFLTMYLSFLYIFHWDSSESEESVTIYTFDGKQRGVSDMHIYTYIECIFIWCSLCSDEPMFLMFLMYFLCSAELCTYSNMCIAVHLCIKCDAIPFINLCLRLINWRKCLMLCVFMAVTRLLMPPHRNMKSRCRDIRKTLFPRESRPLLPWQSFSTCCCVRGENQRAGCVCVRSNFTRFSWLLSVGLAVTEEIMSYRLLRTEQWAQLTQNVPGKLVKVTTGETNYFRIHTSVLLCRKEAWGFLLAVVWCSSGLLGANFNAKCFCLVCLKAQILCCVSAVLFVVIATLFTATPVILSSNCWLNQETRWQWTVLWQTEMLITDHEHKIKLSSRLVITPTLWFTLIPSATHSHKENSKYWTPGR